MWKQFLLRRTDVLKLGWIAGAIVVCIVLTEELVAPLNYSHLPSIT
jgi:hypothetical protein